MLRLDLSFTYNEGSKGGWNVRDGEQNEQSDLVDLVVVIDGILVGSERQGVEGERNGAGRAVVV